MLFIRSLTLVAALGTTGVLAAQDLTIKALTNASVLA